MRLFVATENEGMSMDVYGCLWMYMGVWECVGVCRGAWMCRGVHGCVEMRGVHL